jgi:hypothetical protein
VKTSRDAVGGPTQTQTQTHGQTQKQTQGPCQALQLAGESEACLDRAEALIALVLRHGARALMRLQEQESGATATASAAIATTSATSATTGATTTDIATAIATTTTECQASVPMEEDA